MVVEEKPVMKQVGKLIITLAYGFYDIIMVSDDKKFLRNERKRLMKEGYKPTMISNSIFESPALVIATTSALREAKEIAKEILGGNIKDQEVKR